jgi:hypothetical protein
VRPTVPGLGLSKVMTGTGPRDFAYRGHGYSIAPVTNRFWRLSTINGKQIKTASSLGMLLVDLSEILKETINLD